MFSRRKVAMILISLSPIAMSACTPEQVKVYAAEVGAEITSEDATRISEFYSASVPEMIIDQFDGTGHKEKALSVAKCESGFNPKAKNPTSSASGVFQIIRSTWNAYAEAGESVWNPRDNIRVAYRIWLASGRSWRQWVCA